MAYTSINKPSDYFNTKLTTGTGSSQAVTGLGFQPDFIWGKRRDDTGHHTLFDVVRGITKGLETTGTGAEFTSTDYYDSFDSDGFTIAAGASGAGNGSGQTAVQWSWLAGGTASSNTDGSITSSVSANTTSGFSIVSYTGTGSAGTVGHGLGVAPRMIIVKLRSSTGNWQVYHQSLGNTKAIPLNTTDTTVTDSGFWNNTSPTSSVFSLGTGYADNTNSNGGTYIAYCFAEKKGFSKFGSYTGNGNADGSFIFTGFSPSFVMVKNTSRSQDWTIHDIKRDTYNLGVNLLRPNLSNAEATFGAIDILSNGFKARTDSAHINYSGDSYIYMAFAESPLVGTNNIPAVAR